ncbi:MAG: DUF4345 domain-containing protein [Nevskiaceae bacterium]|nr:MAG: DUF4345 domain-containing protein [Nevskiaceae bacterium]TBR71768.1 MAG: DUF4345 domain-containing protein [Nevskiaceae bacterium]
MMTFMWTVRAVAVIALVTGAIDVLVGLRGQKLIGAALGEGYRDPLLNSQFRYLGAVWFGFGVLLWYCTLGIPEHAGLLYGAFAVVFLGGLGRIASVVQFGFPSSAGGRNFVVIAIAIEVIGMPLLGFWLQKLLTGGA